MEQHKDVSDELYVRGVSSNDVRGAIAMRGLDFVTHMAIPQQRQPLFRHRVQKALQKLFAMADNVTGDVFTGAGVVAVATDGVNQALSQ